MAKSFLIIFYLFVSKLSEILKTGVTPLTGILHLMVQSVVDLTPALFVNVVTHLVVPDVMVSLNGDDATIVVEL